MDDEVIGPLQTVTCDGPGGVRVTVTAEATLGQDTTQICYTLTNESTGATAVNAYRIAICRTFPCAALDLPSFSVPVQPTGCCPSPDDALSFLSQDSTCFAVVTFDPPVLPGECVQFCLTYNGVLQVTTDQADVDLGSGDVLECSTTTVVCPRLLPTTTTTTTTSTTTTTTTSTTTSTTSTTPPPKGLNWLPGQSLSLLMTRR